jgi:ABC-2 type transport system ATP-binding protein
MNETYAVEIRGLEKSYGKVQALRGVDLVVNTGELFGFLGPNGAGKTTTIRCMLDMIRPQAGTLRVLGVDPQARPRAVQERVGYLPGELSLEANLRVEQALRYFIELRGNHVEWGYVRSLTERLELDMRIQIKNLSKGNKQKVGVVQALMHKPDMLLLDEPTAGLDPLMQREVYQLLREAQDEGATIFFSSHIISEVESLADRIAIIREGVIVEEAKPGELAGLEVRRMHIRFKEAVDPSPLNQVQGVTLLSQSDGNLVTVRVEGELDSLVKALAGFPVSDFDLERQSLEEAFLSYYKGREEEVN